MSRALNIEYIVTLIVLGSVGLLCLISPFSVIRTISFWPRFLRKSFGEKVVGNRLGNILSLMDRDPVAYKETYSAQILIIRLSGGLALGMVFLMLCLEIFILI